MNKKLSLETIHLNQSTAVEYHPIGNKKVIGLFMIIDRNDRIGQDLELQLATKANVTPSDGIYVIRNYMLQVLCIEVKDDQISIGSITEENL